MLIRIIDKTLSCLGSNYNLDVPSLLRFLSLLIKTEVDAIELSQEMYDLLSPLPDYHSYIITEQDNAKNKNRINGYDDALCGDYQHLFSQLRTRYGENIEFCPGDNLHCATALAIEWINCSGNTVVTAFGGIGGYAATEEVVMSLRLKGLWNTKLNFDFFPEMAKLIGVKKKPVIGEDIFHVESGVHVDGILKQPECYEPFPPEVVGLKRKIILGKHSGSASIKYKMEKLNIKCGQERIPLILEQVKLKAIKLNRTITDIEFLDIVEECRL